MIGRRYNDIAVPVVIGGAFAAVAVGWAIARYPPAYILGLLAAAAAVVVAMWNRGVLSGILVLLIINGVPFVNLQPAGQRSSGGLYDAAFLALTGLLLAGALGSSSSKAHARIATLTFTWAGLYLAWWTFKVIAGSPGVPLLPAVKYGRVFLYFIIFLPAGLVALRQRSHLLGLALTLAAGAALFSIGQILRQITHVDVGWLIHVTQTNEFEGITRIYAPMNDLVIAAFPMAFAAMLLAPRKWRAAAIGFTLLTGFALALSFTRAVYISEITALIVISFVWAKGTGWEGRRIRYTLGLAGTVVVLGLVLVGGSEAQTTSSSSPFQAVVSRAALGLTDVETGGGTAGYRLHQSHLEFEVLGGNWLVGLGFLNPAYRYFPGLHEGAIQDDDLGSLSVLTTMGLIGLILAYLPPIAGLVYLLRRRYGAVQYGGAMYLTAALIGSITLGAVSTLSGLMVLAAMLVLCVNWTLLSSLENRVA